MAKPPFGFSQGRKTTVKLIGCEIHLRSGINNDDFVEYLSALGLRMHEFQPVMERFGAYLVNEHIPRQFKRQGTPKRWAPLSPAYAERKRRLHGRLPILVLSNRMRRGFRYKVTKRTLRVINRVKAGQKGRGAPRWTYHQNGTSTMPARPMLQITRYDYRRLREFARDYLTFNQGGGVL